MGRRGGGDAQQRTTDQIRTMGHCSEDTSSVHGAHTLPTELLGGPLLWLIVYSNIHIHFVFEKHKAFLHSAFVVG